MRGGAVSEMGAISGITIFRTPLYGPPSVMAGAQPRLAHGLWQVFGAEARLSSQINCAGGLRRKGESGIPPSLIKESVRISEK
jgi:hypothetical protein